MAIREGGTRYKDDGEKEWKTDKRYKTLEISIMFYDKVSNTLQEIYTKKISYTKYGNESISFAVNMIYYNKQKFIVVDHIKLSYSI